MTKRDAMWTSDDKDELPDPRPIVMNDVSSWKFDGQDEPEVKPYYPWVRVAIVLGMAVVGWLAFVVVLWAMARLIWP